MCKESSNFPTYQTTTIQSKSEAKPHPNSNLNSRRPCTQTFRHHCAALLTLKQVDFRPGREVWEYLQGPPRENQNMTGCNTLSHPSLSGDIYIYMYIYNSIYIFIIHMPPPFDSFRKGWKCVHLFLKILESDHGRLLEGRCPESRVHIYIRMFANVWT